MSHKITNLFSSGYVSAPMPLSTRSHFLRPHFHMPPLALSPHSRWPLVPSPPPHSALSPPHSFTHHTDPPTNPRVAAYSTNSDVCACAYAHVRELMRVRLRVVVRRAPGCTSASRVRLECARISSRHPKKDWE